MPITSLGEVGSANNKASGTTLAVANTSASVIPAGTLLLMVVGYDNHASATAATVTPSATGGASWVAHLAPVGSGITTTAGAGIWHTTFACRTVSDVAVGGTLTTLTFSSAVVAKVAMIIGYQGVLATQRGTTSSATSTAGTPSVATTGTAPVAGDLVIGCATFETSATPTPDSDTLNGSWSTQVTEITAGGGAANTNVAITVQAKIVTAGGAQTYNPVGANDSVASLRTLLPEPDPTVTQAAYRFYADGTESGSTALAAQDTGYTADLSGGDVALGLRIRLQSTNATALPLTDDWQLQWEKNASGTWTNVAGLTTQLSSYMVLAQSGYGLDATTFPSMAQSVMGNGQKLTRARFSFAGGGNTPDGTIQAQVWAHTGTFGSTGVPTGAPLTSSTTVLNCVTLSGVTYTDFDFDGTFTLTGGTPYYIGVTTNNTVVGGVSLWTSTTGATPPGSGARLQAPSTWSIAADCLHEILTITSPVPTGVLFYDSPNLTGASATTNRLGAGTGSFVAGEVTEDGQATDLGWSANNYTEVLYSIQLKQADLVNGDVLRFRVLRNFATTGLTYTQTPTLTASKEQRPADTAAGSDSVSVAWDRAKTPADTAAGADAVLPDLAQAAYGFYADGTESGSVALAAQDTPYTADIASGNVDAQLRLRMQTRYGLAAGFHDLLLQYCKNGSGTWRDVAPSGAPVRVDGYTGLVNSPSGTYGLRPAVGLEVGQSFLGQGSPLTRVGVRIAKSGTPDGTVRVNVYAHTGAFGTATGLPTGAALATSTTVLNSVDLPTTAAWTNFDFDGTFTPANGTPYVVAVTTTNTGTAGNAVNVASFPVSASPTHPGCLVKNLAGWSAVTTEDLAFEVYGSPDPAPAVTSYDSVNLTDGAAVASRLTGGFGSASTGFVAEDGRIGNTVASGFRYFEHLYTIRLIQANLVATDVLTFRLFRIPALDIAYEQTPTLTVSAGAAPQLKTPADTAAGSDSATTVADVLRPPADIAAGSDSASFIWDRSVAPADTAAGSDSVTLLSTGLRQPADTAAGSDSVAALNVAVRQLADAAAGSDSVTTSSVAVRQPADLAAGADAQTVVWDQVRDLADTAAGSDSATAVLTAGGIDLTATPADTAAGADSLTTVATVDRTPADTAAGSDSATTSSVDVRQPTDTAAGADAATTVLDQARAGADTAVGADALTVTWDRARTGTDTAAGADTAGTGQDRVSAPTDTAAGLDSSATIADRVATPADIAAGTDVAVTGQSATIAAQVDDTAAGSDQASAIAIRDRTAADTAAGSDSVTADAGRTAFPADTAAGSDAVTTVLDRQRAAADTAAGADVATAAQDRAAFPADTAAGSDLSSTVSDLVRTPADTAAGSDNATTVATVVRATQADDTAAGSDAVTAVWDRTQTAADTAAGADAVATVADRVRTAGDLAGGTDAYTAPFDQQEFPADVAGGTDAASTTRALVRQVDDLATGDDVVASSRTGFTGLEVSDLAAGTDAVTVTAIRARAAADTAAGADAATTVREVTAADTAAGADTAALLADRQRTADDLASGADASTTLASRQRTAADLADGADEATTAASGTSSADVDDTAAGTDELTVIWTRSADVADLATGLDAVTLDWTWEQFEADLATGSDEVTVTATRQRDVDDIAVGLDLVKIGEPVYEEEYGYGYGSLPV